MSNVKSTKDKIRELKKEYDKPRFYYQDTNTIPKFKEIVDTHTHEHYNVKEIDEIIEILNIMHKESMMYPLFVEWLLEYNGTYKGVAKRFENELKYENIFVQKIDKIVHNKEVSHEVYELLKPCLNEDKIIEKRVLD